MNIKTTINENPSYFADILIGDMFVAVNKANAKVVYIKISQVYNADGTEAFNAIPFMINSGHPKYFSEMETVTKVKNATLNVDI